MASFMEALAEAAENKLTLKPPRVRRKDCHPELEHLITERQWALMEEWRMMRKR